MDREKRFAENLKTVKEICKRWGGCDWFAYDPAWTINTHNKFRALSVVEDDLMGKIAQCMGLPWIYEIDA